MRLDPFPVLRPLLHAWPPETAHRLTLWALRAGLGSALAAGGAGDGDTDRGPDPVLAQTLWGRTFRTPIGMAAGFDKNAEVPGPLLRLGFGFVEVGTVTPRPQAGNPKPRVFRLRAERALINRLGFNNAGVAAMAARLGRWRRAGVGPLGVNIGCNRESSDPIGDFVLCTERLAPLADYLAVNVSSPNTPGLRDLQTPDRIRTLLTQVRAARPEGGRAGPPVLVKLAPDFAPAALDATVEAAAEAGADGFIVSNTTLSRPDGVDPAWRTVTGGLSGPPLFRLSTRQLARVYGRTQGRLPLIGVGGIAGPDDAFEKIRAGASLIQLYTSLIYAGPGLVTRIRHGLAHRLRAGGFDGLGSAVGSAAEAWAAGTGAAEG